MKPLGILCLLAILGLAGCDISESEQVVSGRPVLSIQVKTDLASVRNSDTLRVELQNQSTSKTFEVASDYRGLRQVGEYLVSVKPGETRTMEWIVVASPGLSGWLDLSWGSYGQSRRIDFQTR